jgi:hypothetical protein
MKSILSTTHINHICKYMNVSMSMSMSKTLSISAFAMNRHISSSRFFATLEKQPEVKLVMNAEEFERKSGKKRIVNPPPVSPRKKRSPVELTLAKELALQRKKQLQEERLKAKRERKARKKAQENEKRLKKSMRNERIKAAKLEKKKALRERIRLVARMQRQKLSVLSRKQRQLNALKKRNVLQFKPKAPTRPRSAYLLFSTNYVKQNALHPILNAQKIRSAYYDLSEEERNKYVVESERLLQEYREKVKAYKESPEYEMWQQIRYHPRKVTGYNLYIRDYMHEYLKKDLEDGPRYQKTVLAEGARKWKTAPDEFRNRYQERANQLTLQKVEARRQAMAVLDIPEGIL